MREIPYLNILFIFSFQIILFSGCASNPSARGSGISLEEGIKVAVENIERSIGHVDITRRPVIAALNIKSLSNELSAHILDELSIALANSIYFTIVDRQRLDIIRREENFQLSGEVSDETAQAIGRKLGAQYVVTGELIDMGNFYRFRVIALGVETGSVNAPTSENINKNDYQINYFISENRTAQAERDRVNADRAREADDRRKAVEWENFRNNWSLNMIQIGGIAIQNDRDSYTLFLEAGIRWRFFPFFSIIGADIAFNLDSLANSEKQNSGYFTGSIGFVLRVPPVIYDIRPCIHVFGDILMQYEYGNALYHGLFGSYLTPGFDVGVNFAFLNRLGMNIKYKRLWYQDDKYTDNVLVGLTLLFGVD